MDFLKYDKEKIGCEFERDGGRYMEGFGRKKLIISQNTKKFKIYKYALVLVEYS